MSSPPHGVLMQILVYVLCGVFVCGELSLADTQVALNGLEILHHGKIFLTWGRDWRGQICHQGFSFSSPAKITSLCSVSVGFSLTHNLKPCYHADALVPIRLPS